MKAIYYLAALLIVVTPAAAGERKPPARKPDPERKSDRSKRPEHGKKPDAKPVRTPTDMIEEEAVAILKPYDKNADFEIDVTEFEAVQADFKKNPRGPLKQFDKGKDGAVDAMIDRAGMNVKLGSAAPKQSATPPPPPAKKPDAPPPPAAEKKPDAPKPPAKPETKPAPETKPGVPKSPTTTETHPSVEKKSDAPKSDTKSDGKEKQVFSRDPTRFAMMPWPSQRAV